MTLLEKAKQEHPELDEGKIVTWMCPCDFGYEKMEDGCNAAAGDYEKKTCWECWNRKAVGQAAALSVGCADSSPRGGAKREGGEGDGL